MTEVLRVSELSVKYKDMEALRDVSLIVETASIVALLGANGAGKSTLLNSVAGLVKPSRGTISLDGRDIRSVAAFRRPNVGLSLVPEGRRLFAPLTARQNLRLGMLPKRAGVRAGAKEFPGRLEEVLDIFPALEAHLDKATGDLSGGQQQMVALGRALMCRPTLLLLDEPSLGLAPKVVDDVFAALARLREEWNLSILIAEQNAEAVLEIADFGHVLQLGRVVIKEEAKALLADGAVAAAYLGHFQGADIVGGAPHER